jgi:hypothetical protein
VDAVQKHSAWAEPEHGRLIKNLDGEHEKRSLPDVASGQVDPKPRFSLEGEDALPVLLMLTPSRSS